MTSEAFERLINEQFGHCVDILTTKACEYATEDRLHNFKAAAGMMGCDPKEALVGMMAKHTISVYDMSRNKATYPIDIWEEKITDSINYLFLLRALIEEEYQETNVSSMHYHDNRAVLREGESKSKSKTLVIERSEPV